MDAYFERAGPHRFVPTAHTGGAWQPAEMHFSPLAGLMVHAIDRHRSAARGGAEKALGRVTFDILGAIVIAECEIEVRTVRAGRTIELVEAVVIIADRPVAVARAWFSARYDTTAVATTEPEAFPDPEGLARWPISDVWPGGFVSSLDVRPISAPVPGRAIAWLASAVELLHGEATSPQAQYIALIDIANGIAPRQPPSTWLFPNLDLTIHLHRQPTGRWVGLDTSVTFGADGQGLTSTVLHDLNGPVGRAEQYLTVRPVPPATRN